jgi:hypothetical protein
MPQRCRTRSSYCRTGSTASAASDCYGGSFRSGTDANGSLN